MVEIAIISIVACSAGIAGFAYGLFYRKVIEKKIRDSYSTYLEELAENGKKKDFDPHENGQRAAKRKDYENTTDPATWV